MDQPLIINVDGFCGMIKDFISQKIVVIGLITSDRFKRFQANLPMGESLLSFKFSMSMCLL